jgi:peptidyl-prolyl cis-trans isomerase C
LSLAASLAAAENPAAPDKLPPETVVARQGSAVLTMGDIDAFAARIEERQRAGFFNSPKRIETLVSNLLAQRQLAAEAEKAGLEKNASIQAQIKIAQEEILSKAYVDELKSTIKLPNLDQLAHEEYLGHKEKYVIPGKLDVKHILISIDKHSDEEAKAIAEDVRKQAAAHPDDFDALIEKYSEDPSKAQNHGLMTDANNKRYVPQFSAAAAALKIPGEISPVIKTKFGYHVLKLVTRTSDQPQKFDDVKAQIVEQLRTEYIAKAITTQTSEIRNQPIDAKPEVIASLRDRYGTMPTPEDADAAPAKDPKTP